MTPPQNTNPQKGESEVDAFVEELLSQAPALVTHKELADYKDRARKLFALSPTEPSNPLAVKGENCLVDILSIKVSRGGFLQDYLDQDDEDAIKATVQAHIDAVYQSGLKKGQIAYEALKAVHQREVYEAVREGRLAELKYLLEDFGIEDNTEPIKKRIEQLTTQSKQSKEK